MNFLRFVYYFLRRYYDSVNYAIEGILHAAKTQSHVRFHLSAACFLLLVCFSIGISPSEFVILTTLATIVIVAEMLNSAIEVTVDIASPEHNEKARIAKDIAAGAVLVAAAAAAIIAFFIFYPYFHYFIEYGIVIAQHGVVDLIFGSTMIVLITVIMMKAYVGKGHPLRGGLPSGHSALAFTWWVNIVFIYKDFYLTVIFFACAIAIAVSRVVRKIHTIYEVCIGIMTGTLITWGLYLIFYKG
ncbi:MAG: diacylglycerol kinase [Spirochaetes bacterium]|nr:diacylglycerol kinase [Spirochaetota bacterium]MBN2772193.1 diacylglycerol kinase [Spirochaetota bacterium]